MSSEEIEDVICIMIRMNICYKEYCGAEANIRRIFILAIFRDEKDIVYDGKYELI